jgi:hypothetical protein
LVDRLAAIASLVATAWTDKPLGLADFMRLALWIVGVVERSKHVAPEASAS